MRRVTVALDPPYDVIVGAGGFDALADPLGAPRRVALVSQGVVAAEHAPRAAVALRAGGHDVDCITIPDGEAAKTLPTVETLGRAFARAGIRRADAVVALGGGVVGDTAGFAAAVYHRGITVVQAPTTLLAMTDAAIGGKTAVNLPEGKNLLGAFHQPVAVVADVTTLVTLPDPEYRSGLGEVAKYALMPEGAGVAAILDASPDGVRERDPDVLIDLVAECAAVKATIVGSDPEERTGARATLNYGHTLGHALETTGDYAISHGEAVAVGLIFAANLARALRRIGDDTVAAVHDRIVALGLPTRVPGEHTADELVAVMRRDKKTRHELTFVLPGPDGLELVDDPPRATLERAFGAVGVTG
jgi:3-dehydroquinate synthase